MIITPYQTRACVGYVPSLPKLSESLKKAYLLGGGFKFLNYDTQNNCSAAILQPDCPGQIKPFGHPIFVKGVNGDDNIWIADGRTMFSVDPLSQEVKPKLIMNAALTWLETRLRLQLLWDSPNFPIVQSCMDYPIMLYGKVMSEALARKYGLNPASIARCDMLFAYAFWCFSHTEEQYNQASKESLAHLLAMTIRSSGPDINNVIMELPYFHSLNDVVTALQDDQVVGTPKMTSITVVTLFEIAGSFWHITAAAPASEIICCALEHPPTWMACVFLSLSNHSIKNNIGSVAQRYKRLMNPDQFVNSIVHLIGDK